VIRFDQAKQLTTIGDTLYIGFNEGIDAIAFDSLVTVAGALIIEHNPALLELRLPKLTHVGKYIHIHDNGLLRTISMPALQSVGGELSVLRCDPVCAVVIASVSTPASTSSATIDFPAPGAWTLIRNPL
jgi:hypothetical protein